MFSIIIPTWNNLPYLKLCIESIRNNSLFLHEIIVHVNDGDDGTLDWVKSQKIKYSHSQNNIGICPSVNHLVSLANNDWVLYLNDDMVACPGWDKAFIDAINSTETNLALFFSTLIERKIGKNHHMIEYDFGTTPDNFDSNKLLKNYSLEKRSDTEGDASQPTLFHKKWWQIVGGYSLEFSPGMSSDDDLLMKYWVVGCRHFRVVGSCRFYHFVCKSTGRISNTKGGRVFVMKWGLTQGEFYKKYLSVLNGTPSSDLVRKYSNMFPCATLKGKLRRLGYGLFCDYPLQGIDEWQSASGHGNWESRELPKNSSDSNINEKRKLRILFVGTHSGGGGTESHFTTLSKSMRTLGHEVAAVVRPNTPIHSALLGTGIHIYSGIYRNAFDLRGSIAVWRAVSNFKPDWIFGSFSKEYWPLALIARMRGVKLALFRHMDFPLRFLTHHFIPRLADRFIVISKFMRANLISRGVDASRIQMLYNPIDLEFFKPDLELRKRSREQFNFAEGDVVVGFIGAMHPDKGMLPLCDALNQAMTINPKLKAIWVGNGTAVHDLQHVIKNSNFASSHQWHPWSNDVRPYLASLDMLAVPTLVTETFGRISIEAQAFGVPVLCSNLGGLPETIADGITGMLLPVGDIEAWREAILKLSTSKEFRNTMKNKQRGWVENNFSTKKISKQFAELLGT